MRNFKVSSCCYCKWQENFLTKFLHHRRSCRFSWQERKLTNPMKMKTLNFFHSLNTLTIEKKSLLFLTILNFLCKTLWKKFCFCCFLCVWQKVRKGHEKGIQISFQHLPTTKIDPNDSTTSCVEVSLLCVKKENFNWTVL